VCQRCTQMEQHSGGSRQREALSEGLALRQSAAVRTCVLLRGRCWETPPFNPPDQTPTCELVAGHVECCQAVLVQHLQWPPHAGEAVCGVDATQLQDHD
jgi:hypothetical protein